MKFFFLVSLFFLVVGVGQGLLFAAPLRSGFPSAPRPSASQEERARAYQQARQRVIDAAIRYKGTPYVFGGTTARGLDCSGFIYLSFRDALGVSLPRTAAGMYSWAERIPYESAQPGDLLFFRTGNTRRITHVGLYLGNRRFIHSASAGARTGVIYSSLNERYWYNAFAGVGRALPEGVSTAIQSDSNDSQSNNNNQNNSRGQSGNRSQSSGGRTNIFSNSGNVRFLIGAALAPSWDLFNVNGSLVRGITSQFSFSARFNPRFSIGLELRQEYDIAFGIFRMPLALSVGITEYISIFAGPVLSLGEAVIIVGDTPRHYSGGTSWFGIAGITITPHTFRVARNEITPYFEAAWQSYFSDNSSFHFAADASAFFRVSTGIRWRMQI